MRPTLIEIKGFGPFKEQVVVDFAETDLVAIVGPTGSGKSTVIDALTFALYGAVPRFDNKNLIAPVISQSANEAKVQLTFVLGSKTYRATRLVRSKGDRDPLKPRASTAEARLEEVGEDGSVVVLAGNVRELDEVVEQILGLSFEQFCRTIVLPQGEFAKFLRDDPKDRQKLITRLLGLDIYSKIGSKAREHLRSNKDKLAVWEQNLEQFTPMTDSGLLELRKELEELELLQTTIERSAEVRSQQSDRRQELSRQSGQLANDIDYVTSLGRLPAMVATESDDVTNLKEQADEVSTHIKSLLTRKAEIDVARTHQQDEIELRDLLKLFELAHNCAKNLEVEAQTLSDIDEAMVLTQVKLTETSAELEAISNDESQLDSQTQAMSLRAAISPGGRCPVCEQTVSEPPAVVSEEQIQAMVARRENARKRYDQAVAAKAELVGSRATVSERHQAIAAELANCEQKIDGLDHDLITKRLGEVLETASEQQEVSAQLVERQTLLSQLQSSLQELAGANQQAIEELSLWRDGVGGLGPPQITGLGLLEVQNTLASWSESIVPQLKRQLTNLNEDVAAIDTELSEIYQRVRVSAKAVGVELTDLDRAGIAIASQVQKCTQKIADAERTTNEVKRISKEIAELKSDSAVLEVLAKYLKADHFERWLLAEAFVELATRASERLFGLSHEQFSLTVSGDSFFVIDHNNADTMRDARTLSGGETFLASLALALALAESIVALNSKGMDQLGSLFLDEGFGTLDSATLDVVADAIEELSADGPMVAVVTHVRELADRMPIRFEVSRQTSSSVVAKMDSTQESSQ